MCVIAIAVEKYIPLATLKACEQANPHGGGMSWVEGERVYWAKDLSAQEMYDKSLSLPLPHVFHFRIASVGRVLPKLCHPFAVRTKDNDGLTGSSNSVLFHNGTIRGWEQAARFAGIKYPDYASDSMVVARIVALRGQQILKEWDGNKFAIMQSNKEVVMHGGFQKYEGAYFSNTYWTHDLRRAEEMHRRFQSQAAGGYSSSNSTNHQSKSPEKQLCLAGCESVEEKWYQEEVLGRNSDAEELQRELAEEQGEVEPTCALCGGALVKKGTELGCEICGHRAEETEDDLSAYARR